MTTLEVLQYAKQHTTALSLLNAEQKNEALRAMAKALKGYSADILKANKADIEAAINNGMNPVMLDRLKLSTERIEAMAQGILEVTSLKCPVGEVLDTVLRPNGIEIQKVRVAMGVVAIIFESRPNVTSDAAALCLKSGNVCVLRGGKEAFNSNTAIVAALKKGLTAAGFPDGLVNIVPDTSRDSAKLLMTANGLVDLLIPRGGAGLIKACVADATVPCIETGTGICHIYVNKNADFKKALDIIENAKLSRPSVCNAAEVCLVDSAIASDFLPLLKGRIGDNAELRLCERAAEIIDGTPATQEDFDTEFLNYILAIKVVDNTAAAIAHIAEHSTHHSDCIITEDMAAAELFTLSVDSAAVYVNASTRFTDGGEFGLGCEIGISTQKLHARGPMGLNELTTYKYIVRGSGQIR